MGGQEARVPVQPILQGEDAGREEGMEDGFRQEVTQMVFGLVQITFGIPLTYGSQFSLVGLLGTPYWSGIWSLLSGIMMVLTQNSLQKVLILVTRLFICINILASGSGLTIYILSVYSLYQGATSNQTELPETKSSLAITGMLIPYVAVSALISCAFFVAFLKQALRPLLPSLSLLHHPPPPPSSLLHPSLPLILQQLCEDACFQLEGGRKYFSLLYPCSLQERKIKVGTY
ncbi:uncharacterized protein [Narcine bancroftii]|uniref:uncharacterized protein isoform X4 n=1 Tax=Narcine bancroftii TaxID=1343680 RepID=UPI003831EBB1